MLMSQSLPCLMGGWKGDHGGKVRHKITDEMKKRGSHLSDHHTIKRQAFYGHHRSDGHPHPNPSA
jgi:hypothetical protein